MAITQVLLMCLGLCLLAKNADSAVPTISASAITVAENTVAVGTLTVANTPTAASITSQPNTNQLSLGTDGALTVTSGYTLDYEQTGATLVIVALVSNTDGSASVTATITVTDVVEEFDQTIMSVCLSGTSYAAGSQLFTKLASLSTVVGVYTLTAQTPNSGDLQMDASNYVAVATGKTLSSTAVPVYTASLKLVSSAPAVTTSTTVVTITFGCSSGAATIMFATVTLLLALLVATLK